MRCNRIRARLNTEACQNVKYNSVRKARPKRIFRDYSSLNTLGRTVENSILSFVAQAGRSSSRHSEDDVRFDDEEDWESLGTTIKPSAGPIIQQAFNAVGILAGKITQIAMQFTPDNVSPRTVRTAVNAGLILLALSLVKGILSFILLIGTVLFGAYVSVRIFGLDTDGVDAKGRNGAGGKRLSKKRHDRKSEFAGLLGSGSESQDESGLLDVWFERKDQRKRQ